MISQDTPPKLELATLYDYHLHASQNKSPISIDQLRDDLAKSDVVFIGEYHSHSASHKLQAELLQAMYLKNPRLILSMEQFSRDKQQILNQYLKGEIGEQTLINEGDAWDNYRSDYRPLVEFARNHDLQVIGANTPLSIVRCIARKGPNFVSELDEEKQSWVAADVKTSSIEYQHKFAQAMSHHGASNSNNQKVRQSNSFYAQLARDNTMAESIYNAYINNTNSQVIHFNGAFHSNYNLGTVDALKRLDPTLNITVISPVFYNEEIEWDKGDYIYIINPLPSRYIKKENRDKSIMKMVKSRKEKKCKIKLDKLRGPNFRANSCRKKS